MKWKYHLRLYEPLYCSERPLFGMLHRAAQTSAQLPDGFSYAHSRCFRLSALHLHRALRHFHLFNRQQNSFALLHFSPAPPSMRWVGGDVLIFLVRARMNSVFKMVYFSFCKSGSQASFSSRRRACRDQNRCHDDGRKWSDLRLQRQRLKTRLRGRFGLARHSPRFYGSAQVFRSPLKMLTLAETQS